MTERKTAIVLGGIEPHRKLMEVLKARGFYTVLIDYYENPPAKDAADLHLQESTLDKDKVLEIARDMEAQLIIGACVDQANAVACYVAEELGLTKPYSYSTAMEVTNKDLMKSKMIANGIPTSKHVIRDAAVNLDRLDLKYPIVVKPVDNNGSKGVKKLESPEKLKEYVEYALSMSRAGRAVIEEFVEGDEIQIDCFAGYDDADVIMIRKKLKIEPEEGMAMQAFGSLIPAGITPGAEAKIREIATNIKKGFRLNNTPFFMQTIVKGDDVSVIEFAPRIGGSLSSYLIETITGFDMISASVSSYLEEPVKVEFHAPDHFVTTNIMYAYKGVLDHVEGQDELLADGVIEKFMYSKTKGMEIDSDNQMDSRNRVASYVIRGGSIDELLEKVERANSTLKIVDDKGKDIMRKNAFLTREMI